MWQELEPGLMIGIGKQIDAQVSQRGSVCDQSFTDNCLNLNIDMLDSQPENGYLEEELERIIMLADSITEKALSTAKDFAATKKQNGKKNMTRSPTMSSVLRRSRKNLRSGCCTNKSSMILHGQPRLSPLAARAALAAAVAPLRQASQTSFFRKSQGLGVHSEMCKAGTNFFGIAKKDDRNIHDEKCQNTSSSVRRSCQPALVGSFECDRDIQLMVDIPIYGHQCVERSMNLVIDLPIF